MHTKRFIEQRLLTALGSSSIVFLNGPRQAGKSTLQAVAKKIGAKAYITFDNVTEMMEATHNPADYLNMASLHLLSLMKCNCFRACFEN